MERSDLIMAMKRPMLITFKSFLRVLLFVLKVCSVFQPLKQTYLRAIQWPIQLSKKNYFNFKFGFVEVGIYFCFLHFSSSNAGGRQTSRGKTSVYQINIYSILHDYKYQTSKQCPDNPSVLDIRKCPRRSDPNHARQGQN